MIGGRRSLSNVRAAGYRQTGEHLCPRPVARLRRFLILGLRARMQRSRVELALQCGGGC
jgi:hypothetical protein